MPPSPPSLMYGVGFMVRLVELGSGSPDFKSHSAIELVPGGIDLARHPSEVGKMSSSLRGCLSQSSVLHRSGDPSRIVPNNPGDCFTSTDALYRLWSQWMDGWMKRIHL